MDSADLRRPALVRDAFHRRLAAALAPHGFVANTTATKLKRKRGPSTDVVELSSSHHNAPGAVSCFVALAVEDALVRKATKGWRAGGVLTGPNFSAEVPTEIARASEADRLLAEVVARLAFFDLLAAPARVSTEVQGRYVPGIIAPTLIVPYLRAHLGPAATLAYARALLAGRPELWPGFLGPSDGRPLAPSALLADHGSQLALALGDDAAQLTPPAGVTRAEQPTTAYGRSFLGLQLRAWGEPEAAAMLARLADREPLAVRAAQDALGTPITVDVAAVRVAMAAVGLDRAPRRAAPSPTLFQYHARHATFARS